MSDAVVARPALPARYLYPERPDWRDGKLDRFGRAVSGAVIARAPGLYLGQPHRIVRAVNAEGKRFDGLDLAALRAELPKVRGDLRRTDMDEASIARAFALLRRASELILGMRHFDVQLIGGYALLKGAVAEMETGEGKTLTATLPAATAALAGIPVHVVTVNDYLAERDANIMRPLYSFLGLSLGIIKHGLNHEQKQAAYGCEIAYCTNKELAFDYLRDRMLLGRDSGNIKLKFEALQGEASRSARLLLRGLHFAIVDEADSVLIDEARTPLIISGESDGEAEAASIADAAAVAAQLVEGEDYRIIRDQRRVELTGRGKAHLEALTAGMGRMWRILAVREELARMALTAQHLFHRDEHYLVRDGKVQIIDEYTGRVMEDRFWGRDLHQLIEIKEDCEMSSHRVTLARITYQRFFRRYRRLAGMTGTAREVASELWSVFGLPVYAVRTNRPVRRQYAKPVVCPSLDEKWLRVTTIVAKLHERGVPVLVGTRSVAASETASVYLEAAGLPHRVLSAAQDTEEAEIVAAAGELGRITVATNMAGRGTDIKLADGVVERGGLAVVLTERHDSARIDRQLAGRSGRQGDPGLVLTVLSLQDSLLEVLGDGVLLQPLQSLSRTPLFRGFVSRQILRLAQETAESSHSRMRRDLLKHDRNLGRTLAFSGSLE